TKVAAASGYFNLMPDPDGVLRWMPLVIQSGEDAFPPLAVLCAWYYLGKPQLAVKVGRSGVEGLQMGKRFIPTNETGQLLITYLGSSKPLAHFPIAEFLSGKVARGTFTDKIVLVGATATGAHDVRPIPLSPAYPGVEIHATVTDNILTQNFLAKPLWSTLYDLLAIITLGVLAGIALPHIGALKGVLCAAGLFIVYVVLARW